MDREGRYQLPRYFIKNNGPVKNCFEAKSRPISALPFAGQFRDESRLLEKEGENHFFPFSISRTRRALTRASLVCFTRKREIGCNQPSRVALRAILSSTKK